jgi:hypothetical protein
MNFGASQNVCWPTYKRYYKKPGLATACVQTINSGPGAIDDIMALFNLKDVTALDYYDNAVHMMQMNEDRHAWDLGWLDRILYFVGDAGEADSADVDVQIEDCWDCFDVVLSDHTPVILHFRANVEAPHQEDEKKT